MSTDTINRAADKASPRRFSGEAQTDFGILPADSLVTRMEKIWHLPPVCVAPDLTDEEALALDEAADLEAQEQADWDDLQREKAERISDAPGFGPWGQS